VSPLYCFLSGRFRSRWSARRVYHATGARKGGRSEPAQTSRARSRAARAGVTESRVVDRIQPAAENSRLRLPRTSSGSPPSLYEVQSEKIPIAGSILILLLAGYKRLISPLLPSACRFYPTCSDYMRQAIETHGPAQGIWLGVKRLGRCHPFHAGGFDAVPEPASGPNAAPGHE